MTRWGVGCYHQPHFTGGEEEAQRAKWPVLNAITIEFDSCVSCNKWLQSWWLKTAKIYSLTVLEARSLKYVVLGMVSPAGHEGEPVTGFLQLPRSPAFLALGPQNSTGSWGGKAPETLVRTPHCWRKWSHATDTIWLNYFKANTFLFYLLYSVECWPGPQEKELNLVSAVF